MNLPKQQLEYEDNTFCFSIHILYHKSRGLLFSCVISNMTMLCSTFVRSQDTFHKVIIQVIISIPSRRTIALYIQYYTSVPQKKLYNPF